jgi:hypothetical protein
MPDAGVPDASVDTPPAFPACREFSVVANTVPAHVTGSLSAADIQSPQCAAVDAPYGIESAGPDSVVALDDLVVGAAYRVRLRSASDLAFYVATGCSTMDGPSAAECPLFVDALGAGGDELGRFVATAARSYIVVDYYASAMPSSQTFTLDVYLEECTTDASCGGATPVCSDGRCVACADSFDCTSSTLPRCDLATNTCAAGVDTCATEDASEPVDDGPSGAYAFGPDGGGDASTTSEICSSPRTEEDYYSFQVTTIGEVWDLTLAWTGTRDLDMEVYDATGAEVGLSYWEQPETMRLTYLPIGTYYIKVTDFAQTSIPIAYSLAVHRTTGTGCTTRDDCASEYRNQVFRGDCVAGACVPLNGNGAAASGAACDSISDCASGLSCPSFYFVADADTRGVCTPTCTDDTGCAAMGTGYVCTSFLITNVCVQKCTTDEQCPVDTDSKPSAGPWYRLRCQTSSGKCVP